MVVEPVETLISFRPFSVRTILCLDKHRRGVLADNTVGALRVRDRYFVIPVINFFSS